MLIFACVYHEDMRKVVLIIFTLNSLIATGQSLVSVRGGLNVTNVAGGPLKNNDFKVGLVTGVGYEHLFKGKLLLGVDVIYNQRGFKNDSYFVRGIPNSPVGNVPAARFAYNYLSLPIKGGVIIGEGQFNGFAAVGIMPSFLIKAVTKTPTVDTNGQVVGGTDSSDVTDSVSTFDFAGLLEVGLNYNMNERYWLFSSLLYQNSFTSITTSDYFDGYKMKHYGLMLSFGVKYQLKN